MAPHPEMSEGAQWQVGQDDDERPALLFFDKNKLEWVAWEGADEQPAPSDDWLSRLKERLYWYGVDEGEIDPFDDSLSPETFEVD